MRDSGISSQAAYAAVVRVLTLEVTAGNGMSRSSACTDGRLIVLTLVRN